MDVVRDPVAREKLMALGLRSVPVVSRGDRYTLATRLQDVADFIGINGPGVESLPPEQLVPRWLDILAAAQRFVRQVPDERIDERAIESRPRSIQSLAHHVFRIGEGFLDTAVRGQDFDKEAPVKAPEPGTCRTGAEIAEHGARVAQAIDDWWRHVDRARMPRVETYYGAQPMEELLERCTWHSAQHTRQLMAVLERLEIEPDTPLTPADLAGLPLPQGLWE